MAPARSVPGRTRAALCAATLAALLPLMPFALNAQSAPPPAAPAAPDAAAAPAAPDTSAAPAQPAGTPQLNDDGTPKLDAAGNVITEPAPPPPPPPCKPSKGHKCPKVKKKKKEKPPKVTPAIIARGILTVDGVIGKAALNYNIPDLKFIYIYAPGIGAVVISDNKFPGAVEQKGAFNGHSLKVKAGGHDMELYSDDILLGKKAVVGKGGSEKKAESAFVLYNATYTMPSRFPTVGYGNKPDPPYAWPGSRLNVTTKGIDADAPPVPTVLTPTLAKNPCPTGLVLINAPPIAPAPAAAGQTATGTAANPATLVAADPSAPKKPAAPPKCVLPKDVPKPPPPTEKYVPLDQRPRS